ncbi:MAG: hypothetical protein E7539_02095 [Ruminococcaceae bacterium]|nr:hypothetical protein [Oscillospiraceae bacterium]
MDEYKKPYFILFSAMCDIFDNIDQLDAGSVKEIIYKAQNEAEDAYVMFPEEQEKLAQEEKQ